MTMENVKQDVVEVNKTKTIMKNIIGLLIATIVCILLSIIISDVVSHFLNNHLFFIIGDLVAFAVGGFISGYIVCRKGWLYGMLTSIFTIVINTCVIINMLSLNIGESAFEGVNVWIILISRFLDKTYTSTYFKFVWLLKSIFFNYALPLIAGTFGGYMGELYMTRKDEKRGQKRQLSTDSFLNKEGLCIKK